MLAFSLLLALVPQTPKPLAELKFEMAGNRIYLPAVLNGRTTPAIFDTGAGASAVDLKLADDLKIPGEQKIQAGGVGAAAVTGRLLQSAKADIGGQSHPINFAIPFSSLNSAEGRPLEMILGFDYINRYTFQIDYAAQTMRIYPANTIIPDSGTEIPIRIVTGHPHIRAKIGLGGQTHEVEAMIDSGASSGSLTGRFTQTVPIPSSVKSTPSTIIGGGVGGFVSGRFIRLDSIDLNGLKVENPIATVTEAEGGANGTKANYDYLLGADVLKRFTLTLDYANKRVYLKPNSEAGKPFEADKSGLRLLAGGPDLRSYTIAGVLPGSSSDQAGLKSGDILISIDGMAANSKSLQEWRDYLRFSKQKTWTVIVDRKGEKIEAKVEVRPVI
jgi:predicted aspartyl protease